MLIYFQMQYENNYPRWFQFGVIDLFYFWKCTSNHMKHVTWVDMPWLMQALHELSMFSFPPMFWAFLMPALTKAYLLHALETSCFRSTGCEPTTIRYPLQWGTLTHMATTAWHLLVVRIAYLHHKATVILNTKGQACSIRKKEGRGGQSGLWLRGLF